MNKHADGEEAQVAQLSSLRRASLKSGAWATIQQLAVLGSNAVSAILITHALPVSEFGIFSFVTTLGSMGTVVVTAGLTGLAIKELVSSPNQRATMGSLLAIRETSALLAYVALLAVALVTGEGTTWAYAAVALLVLPARGLDATELWFQSRAQSNVTAPIRIGAAALVMCIRLGAIFLGAPLGVFIVLYTGEAILASALLFGRYWLDRASPRIARPDGRRIRGLVGRSWLLLLSSIAGQINSRADIILLGMISGASQVGIYAAAARLSEVSYFLPVVFMTATFPHMLKVRSAYGSSSAEYRRSLQSSYDQALWWGVGIAVAAVLAGPFVMRVLYPAAYDPAGQILRIHVLALPFVFMAAVLSKWIVAEDTLVGSLWRHGLGAAINIGLNLLLIPQFGGEGAAWATVVSYTVASYLACFLTSDMRSQGLMMTYAWMAPLRYVRTKMMTGEK